MADKRLIAHEEFPAGGEPAIVNIPDTGRFEVPGPPDILAASRAIYSRLPLASADFADRVIDGLRKAGLPE